MKGHSCDTPHGMNIKVQRNRLVNLVILYTKKHNYSTKNIMFVHVYEETRVLMTSLCTQCISSYTRKYGLAVAASRDDVGS
jgi:hypothetical protein